MTAKKKGGKRARGAASAGAADAMPSTPDGPATPDQSTAATAAHQQDQDAPPTAAATNSPRAVDGAALASEEAEQAPVKRVRVEEDQEEEMALLPAPPDEQPPPAPAFTAPTPACSPRHEQSDDQPMYAQAEEVVQQMASCSSEVAEQPPSVVDSPAGPGSESSPAAAVVVEEGSNTPPQHAQQQAPSSADVLMEPAEQEVAQPSPSKSAVEEKQAQPSKATSTTQAIMSSPNVGGGILAGARGRKPQLPVMMQVLEAEGGLEDQLAFLPIKSIAPRQQHQHQHQPQPQSIGRPSTHQRQPAAGESAVAVENGGERSRSSGGAAFHSAGAHHPHPPSARSHPPSRSRSDRQRANPLLMGQSAPFASQLPLLDRPIQELVQEGLFREFVNPATGEVDSPLLLDLMHLYDPAENHFSFDWDRHPTTSDQARQTVEAMMQEIAIGLQNLGGLLVEEGEENRKRVLDSFAEFKQRVLTRAQQLADQEQAIAEDITQIDEAEREMEELCGRPL